MFKIYIGANYPDKFRVEDLTTTIKQNAVIVTNPDEADFFLFPVSYEILHEFTEEEYTRDKISKDELEGLRTRFIQMADFSSKYNKKLILFYYRDPVQKINVRNAIVFRTSLLRSTRNNEYAQPAYLVNDIGKEKTGSEFLFKSENPTVGFRGQSAPVKLDLSLTIKRKVNKLFESVGINKSINLHFNYGYLARRDAILACLNNSEIKSDINITSKTQSIFEFDNGKEIFLNNLFNNQYNICASGHGNYSLRLYETLCGGRIPVFIDTDCVLPFEEFIDWKQHIVWVDEKEVGKTDKLILQFHKSFHPDDFLQLQQNNRLLWEQYLCKTGFFENLYKYFDLINKV
jgi:hypothetical protein